MKKLVPDPPPVLCVGPDLSPEEALSKAEQHLNRALSSITYLPSPAMLKHQHMLSGIVLNMKICKALLAVAQSKSAGAVPV